MISSHHSELFVHDAFLAEQLARDVRRVDAGMLQRMGAHQADAISEAMEALDQPTLVYAKLLADAPAALLSLLCSHGFDVIDTAVTLERTRMEPKPDACAALREAQPADERQVAELATQALTSSRFHRDPALPWALAQRVKSAWARNYFAGLRGDVMIVAPGEAGIDGFLLATSATDGAMVIDLVAVAARARRRGLGRAMTIAAQQCVPGANVLRVGTQGSNRDSLEAYRRMRFNVVRTELVLHAHVDARAAQAREVRCA